MQYSSFLASTIVTGEEVADQYDRQLLLLHLWHGADKGEIGLILLVNVKALDEVVGEKGH